MSIPQQADDNQPGREHPYNEPSEYGAQERASPSFERVPPQNLEAEQSVLGGMMLSKDALEDVAVGIKLKGRDFYRPAHETIFRTILGLYAKGEPVDPITVAAELTRHGDIARVGGAAYLHDLVQSVPTAANAEYYAGIVQETAVFRRLVETGTKITQIGYRGGEVPEALNEAGSELFQVADDNSEEDFYPVGDDMEADLDALEAHCKSDGSLAGLPTGFTDLDSLLSGLQEEQFIIVAARPAMGKSTLAMDFVRENAIENGTPSAFFSLEMGRREINHRLWSSVAKVPLHHIKSGAMTDEDWTRLAREMPKISAAPLYVDASPNQTLMDIRAKARRMVQRYDIKLIVIDYIQLMQTGGKGLKETRQQEVSDISRGLKVLAKELHVPIIGLSQLNRGPESREDKKPQVSDLRESGSLEQDADLVILLHREDAYEKESPRAGEADLIVGKHRNGATATITVAFQGHYSRFVDMAQT
ncbi:replicative DNA helicase [Streptomyces antimycoticus]|uniref:Replicative DNA helicase n=1 Tax=Streptomyces antimycoticus TaxID=68175 RepID=A0A4D4KL94_9ACTN|nr:replicative DNA helicase [Streptomyces antimycoticus]GDY49292.1 replicative DNA helicase [Streptomyces antimycoticus]